MSANLQTPSDTQNIIEQFWIERDTFTPQSHPKELKLALQTLMDALESGTLRAATPSQNSGEWETHAWIKQGILLGFKINPNQLIEAGFTQFYDKVPLQFQSQPEQHYKDKNVRIVPPACVRRGAHIGANTVLMPSYVNIGAYIDSGCMIDTWATVGSCVQIGKNVHISGGVGIGGVLEPLQANPTIIEDNCFIGARSEIVEGVIVEEGAVISMGVYIGQSTRIYDRETGEITFGRVPKGAVVVSGTLPSQDGRYGLYSAIIVKRVDQKLKDKLAINDILRSIPIRD